MKKEIIIAHGIRFSVEREGKEAGRARLYLMQNDLHSEPFGLLEDVFVDKTYRGHGIATELVKAVIEEAKQHGCYKLIATSRNDGTKESIHDWYERLGLRKYGVELRMDL